LVTVIDCTLIGASPPTATLPTSIRRVFLRGTAMTLTTLGLLAPATVRLPGPLLLP
jgi:hypothetical protein